MPSIGEQVLHYEIIAPLGQGGMGQVFSARDTRLDRDVALKFGLPHSNNQTLRDRLIIEAKAVARLDHPHIGVLHSIEEVDQALFLCMALYHGNSLEDILTKNTLPLEKALGLAKQILLGLAHAHQQGIVHRDIKPANIFVTEDEQVKILDFGIARLAMSNVTAQGEIVGTPQYISPEQLRGEVVDNRADIWSFAVLLFQMLTGTLPFQGEFPQIMVSILKEDPIPLDKFLQHPALQTIIERCLAKTREERYPSCDALLQALQALTNQNTNTQTTTTTTTKLPQRSTPSQTPPSTPQNRISRRRQTLIGRVDDIADIAQMLEQHPPLVTIVGIGGAGKTSLAKAILEQPQLTPSFPDGHYFIPLDAIQESKHIPQLLLQGLELEAMNQDPWDVCLSFLAEKTALIVLDNLEQFTEDAATLIEDLLTACPNLGLLCTSREILNLADETVYDLKGLSIPRTPNDELMAFGATNLFTTLATRQQRTFDSTTHKTTIIEICQLLDGWPLGIELAAAWVKHLPLDTLKDKLQASLNFLHTRSRSHASRHQSAQAAFDSSWQLLSDEEQTILSCLAVFQGGFTLEAAQAITNTSLEVLACLMDKSLIAIDNQGRYTMHPLVWQLSREKLKENPTQKAILEEAHANFFAEFLSKQPDLDRVMETRPILGAIEADFSNIRQAWFWAVERQDETLVGKSVANLRDFFRYTTRLLEGEQLFQPAHDALDSESVAYGKVTFALGLIKGLRGNKQGENLMLLERSVVIFEAHQANNELVFALKILATQYGFRGHYDLYKETSKRCLEFAEEIGDNYFWAWALANIAQNPTKMPSERISILQQSIATLRENQGYFPITHHLMNLALQLSKSKGDYQRAYDLLNEAIKIERSRGWKTRLTQYLNLQGQMCYELGRFDEAQQFVEESLQLTLVLEIGINDWVVDKCYFLFYLIDNVKGDVKKAKTHLQKAFELARDRIAIPNKDWNCVLYLSHLARVTVFEDRLDDARTLCEHALEYLSNAKTNIVHDNLLGFQAEMALAFGEIEQANAYVHQALKLVQEQERLPAILENLVTFADICKHQGDTKRAAEILGCVKDHRAAGFPVTQKAAALLFELDQDVEPAVLEDVLASLAQNSDL